jgi:hypothetical protein
MKMNISRMMIAATAVAMLAGCASTQPLEARLDAMEAKLNQQANASGSSAVADNALATAKRAEQKADQALAAAKNAQETARAANERAERMFERSQTKR